MVISPYASIVKETAPLSEEYFPPHFPGREAHQVELLECLSPVLRKDRPVSTWLHGPPGSGKSSITRMVLGQLEEQRVRTAYVNCWSSQTFFAVLESLIQELRALVGEKREVSFKFERLSRIVRKNQLVIVLDELDQMFLKERNATLYNLTRLDHAGIVCLSESRAAFLSLDSRVRSRLQPHFINFPQYSQNQLIEILGERARKGLEPESWSRRDLERIAQSSGGDARVAIQTLRTAAYLADNRRIPHIHMADIEQGLRKSNLLKRRYFLKSLSEHHRLLFQIVKESREINSAELWKQYKIQAKQFGLAAIFHPVPT